MERCGRMSRAPYSTKKPKVVYEDTPIRGVSNPEMEPEQEAAPKTEATRGGVVTQPKEGLPEVHLGEYHDPADRFKPRREPEPKPVIVGRAAPIQEEPVKPVSEPTSHRLTDVIDVKPGDWGNIGLKNPFGGATTTLLPTDTTTSGKPEATRFKVEPVKGKK